MVAYYLLEGKILSDKGDHKTAIQAFDCAKKLSEDIKNNDYLDTILFCLAKEQHCMDNG